ncbi:MAG: hypothetical protein IMZ46_04120 [Acidobacteria bacterium]|nr:hypothetical protein [Acidobacteriota bacterium]
MFKRFAALAAVVVLFGLACSLGGNVYVSQKSKVKFFRENSGITYEVKQAILANELLIGMTEQEVVAAIGRPDDINRSTYSFGTTAQFCYDSYGDFARAKYSYVYFENGRVTGWQQ